MCSVAAIPWVLSAVGIGMSIDQGQKAENAQKDATAQAKVTAAKTADQADQANNRANGKQPDIAGIASANEQAAKGGISGTMLTGPTGIDPKQLMLGKSTLLGG